MDLLIAYCGLACNTCPIHLATLEKNTDRRRSMREAIAKACAEEYGMNLQVQEITDCDGCKTGKMLFSGCARCEIRICAAERKIESCAFCDDYACERLQKHFDRDPGARTRLEEIRERKI